MRAWWRSQNSHEIKPVRLNTQDWRKLQVTLITLVVVMVAVVALFLFAQHYRNQQTLALQVQQNLLNAAKQRYQSSGLEKNTIIQYLPRYQALINKGFVGEERRLEWVSALRAQHQNFKLFSIKYSIGLQEPYKPSFATNLGEFDLNRSTMTLDLDMLHEEDILQLTGALAKNQGVFMLRDCEMTRLNAGSILNSQLIANLHTTCELDWLTLREPTYVQVAKP